MKLLRIRPSVIPGFETPSVSVPPSPGHLSPGQGCVSVPGIPKLNSLQLSSALLPVAESNEQDYRI